MARFDRPCMTFYQSAIVTIALSCIVCELSGGCLDWTGELPPPTE